MFWNKLLHMHSAEKDSVEAESGGSEAQINHEGAWSLPDDWKWWWTVFPRFMPISQLFHSLYGENIDFQTLPLAEIWL